MGSSIKIRLYQYFTSNSLTQWKLLYSGFLLNWTQLRQTYGRAKIDGEWRQLSNYKVEGPKVFYWDGSDHNGRIVRRIREEDVIINASEVWMLKLLE